MYKCTMYAADNRPFKNKRNREDALFLPSYINCTSYIVPSYIFFGDFSLFICIYAKKSVPLCPKLGNMAKCPNKW